MTDDSELRVPPNDQGAERAVLGGMLQSKDAIADVIEIIRSDDFYVPANAAVFDAIVHLYSEGHPADAIPVANHLDMVGAKYGGRPYLHTLLDAVPTAANAGWYAKIVAGKARLRALTVAAASIGRLGYNPDCEPDQAVDKAQQIMFEVGDRRTRADAHSWGQLVQPTLDHIEAVGQGTGPTAVPTGFADLDRILGGGLFPGQLIIVAGRPSMGKSVTLLDFVRAAGIKHQIPAALFSLEMSKEEVMTRALSAESKVPLNALRDGSLDEDDWVRLARRLGDIGDDVPIFVDDTPGLTMPEIRAKARRMAMRDGLRLLGIDYLQLITTAGRSESRQQEVSDMSRGLKLLAKELHIPVVAVCQLNRGPENRTDKRPMLSDLRESGSLEQDADVVILVHRDDYYDKDSPRAGEADFIVAKQRNGPTGVITVAAQLHFSRFADMAI